MPRKPKSPIPTSQGWYFSVANFKAHGGEHPENVETWALDPQGVWWVNGFLAVQTMVPEDLWPVRMIQR